MSFYKFRASDLDGTLLNTRGETSRENLEAIKTLHDMGVSFVPTTGRAYNEIPSYLKENPYIRYIIYSSGVAIYDKAEGKKMCSFGMTHDLTNRLFSILEKYDTHVTVRYEGISYIDEAQTDDEVFPTDSDQLNLH